MITRAKRKTHRSRLHRKIFEPFIAVGLLSVASIGGASAAGSLDQQISSAAGFSAATPGDMSSPSSFSFADHVSNLTMSLTSLGTPPPPVVQTLFLSGSLDGTYNTNLFSKASNPVAALTTTPSFGGTWQRTDGPSATSSVLKISLGASTADSAEQSAAFDKSIISGSISLEENGWTLADCLHPVFSYTPQIIEANFFDHHLATFHDMAVGLKHTRTPQTGDMLPDTTIQLTLSGTQRLSDVDAFNSRTASVALTYSATVLQHVGFGASVTGSDIWYADGTNVGRNDQLVRLKAEFDYPSMAEQSQESASQNVWVLKAAAQFSQYYSNRAAFRDDGWLVGTSLTWRSPSLF